MTLSPVDITEAAVDRIASDCEQYVVASDDANHAAVVLRALRSALTAREEALRLAYNTMAQAHARIHGLPRTTDSTIAHNLEFARAEIEKVLK